MTEDLKNIKWGMPFDKWGIVERKVRMKDRNGRLQPKYVVVESSVAAFTTIGRRVAVDLSHDEASALCAIMNVGGDSDG